MSASRLLRTVLLLAGPTASGKTAAALVFAADIVRHGRRIVIVNADSMQVYRDLRILTARPTPHEEAACAHRLFGHVDAALPYSAALWQADAAAVLREAWQAGALPLVIGGSGLYLRALIHGLSAIPAVPPDIRARIRMETEADTATALHARLQACDPDSAARLRPGDRQRILRALEVTEATGLPLSHWQALPPQPPLPEATFKPLVLIPDRARLRARIDARFHAMIAAGALDEVRALAARQLDPALPALRAHGVPALSAHLRGEISLADALTRGQADTRAYAKRQFTWFRHQTPGWPQAAPEDAASMLLDMALEDG